MTTHYQYRCVVQRGTVRCGRIDTRVDTRTWGIVDD